MFKKSYNRTHRNTTNQTYFNIFILALSLILAEVLYCSLLLNSNFFFVDSEGSNLIPTIFWANFALPFLV